MLKRSLNYYRGVKSRLFWICVLFALILAGCNSGSHPPRIGNPAPDFSITDSQHTVVLSQLRGKPVVLNFWATWCPPCIRELPNVKKMYETYHSRGFEVIGISQDRAMEPLTKFLEKEKLPWVNLFDQEKGNGLADYYGVMSIPLAILVDQQGRVVSMEARGEELGRLLEKYLPEKK